jgi:hypothetical protein
MYAARDKDGTLVLYEKKPHTHTKDGMWVSVGHSSQEIVIPRELLPELTFKMGPVEIELVIKNQTDSNPKN